MTQSHDISNAGTDDETIEGVEADEEETEELTAAGYEGDDDDYDGPPAEADAKFVPPKGAVRVSQDVKGYWDPKDSGPVYFIPRSMRLMDNGQDEKKSSALILCELLKPIKLIENTQNKEDRKLKLFPKGTPFGIWAKAGMRELGSLGGCHVVMAPDGSRKLPGREKPMALFACYRLEDSPKTSGTIPLIEDARKTSVIELALNENVSWWLSELGPEAYEAATQALEEMTAANKAKGKNKGKSRPQPATEN